MFDSLFVKDALERAIATAAQALLAVWGADAAGVFTINWGDAASVAGMAAVLSVLKSIVASQVGDKQSASLSPAVGVVDMGETAAEPDDGSAEAAARRALDELDDPDLTAAPAPLPPVEEVTSPEGDAVRPEGDL